MNVSASPGTASVPDNGKAKFAEPKPVSSLATVDRQRNPGRPRKIHSGPVPDTLHTKSRINGTSVSDPILPRLLNLKATANYLGVSPWTVRDLEARKVLKRISVPLSGGAELRKLLFDKVELDRLIEVWKA